MCTNIDIMSINKLLGQFRRKHLLVLALVCLNIMFVLISLKNTNNLLMRPIKLFISYFQPLKIFENGNTSTPVLLNGHQWVLDCLTRGRWLQRNLTEQEETLVVSYLVNARGVFNIPRTFQRPDGRCGDVPYEGSPLSSHMWFRSICNPKGETSCCKNNSCLPFSTDECRCDTCLDERQAIHSEFSTCIPDNERCELQNFTTEQACHVLNGSTISFVGDSFMRHVYIAMVIQLNGKSSALKQHKDKAMREQCRGWYQITHHPCRSLLNESMVVCNDTVKVNYIQVFPSQELSLTLPLLEQLRHTHKSLVVFGLGIHDDFNLPVVSTKFMWPFLNLRQFLSTNLDQDIDLKDVLTNCSWSSWETTGRESNNTDSFNRFNYFLPRKAEAVFQEWGAMLAKSAAVPGNLLPLQKRLVQTDTNHSNNRFIALQSLILRLFSEKNKSLNESEYLNVSYNVSIVYDKLNKKLIFQTFPDPLIKNDKLWPRLLWLGIHAPGLLKSPKFPRQTPAGVKHYNKEIQRILHHWDVPYLDTYSFTKGVVSYDGTHYGWGINMLKVNMILTYIQATNI